MDHSEQSVHAAAHDIALIERHQPWEMLDGMALSIIDDAYAAALGIVGRGEEGYHGGVVEISAADPGSPVLTVHASRAHCLVALNDSPRGGGDSLVCAYRRYTSPKQKWRPRHRLGRASVSVSPGTLYLSRDAAAAGGGVLAILDMIVARLGAAIGLEEALLAMARTSSYEGPKVDEILRVRNALDEIRSEMDLPALMRRLLHKRRGVTEITTCRPAAAAGAAATEQDQADETERLMKKMRLKC
uniref:Uncharacterized protein n=1 Tax=Oryza glumipatula TaxID=40148 RepID=A0A0E0B3M0_9ORYZ